MWSLYLTWPHNNPGKCAELMLPSSTDSAVQGREVIDPRAWLFHENWDFVPFNFEFWSFWLSYFPSQLAILTGYANTERKGTLVTSYFIILVFLSFLPHALDCPCLFQFRVRLWGWDLGTAYQDVTIECADYQVLYCVWGKIYILRNGCPNDIISRF